MTELGFKLGFTGHSLHYFIILTWDLIQGRPIGRFLKEKILLNWNRNVKINHSVSRFGKHEKMQGGGKRLLGETDRRLESHQ